MSREYFQLYDAASLSQSRMHLGNKAIVVLSLIDVSESGIFLPQCNTLHILNIVLLYYYKPVLYLYM